ncbi:MAG: DUF5385 family protein [Mycoplasmoidaceae bacterium]
MGNNFLMILIFLIPVGVLVWWFIKKRKTKSTAKINYQKRRREDEVWKTIKNWLKTKKEFGKEIVECYVAKRITDDVIDRKKTKEEQKKQKDLIAKKKLDENLRKKELKKKGLKYHKELPKDLYVALFITRNAKTKIEDEPRAIECSVIQEKISKKETARKIIVLRELNYAEENAWISSIKKKEEDEANKIIEKKIRNQQRIRKIKKIVKSNNKKSENKPTNDESVNNRLKNGK